MDIFKDEEHLLLEEEHDGIRELDNRLPPWWLWLFYLTIIYSVVYFVGSDLLGWIPSPEEEYKSEVAAIEAMKKSSGKSQKVDGKALYLQHCAVCHGQQGQGVIGPNLTDNYWKNGEGTLEDIQKIIANGVPPQMPAWQQRLGERAVRALAEYVLSLQGTNPPNPKKPEGKLVQPKKKK